MKSVILLDTSGLLCYVYRDQPGHEEAVQLLDSAGKSITHSYVLAELVALAQVRHYPRLATLEFITDLLENPDIETVWIDEPLHRAAVKLLMARQDKTYSLCDAVSFLLMSQFNIIEALTSHRHFEQEVFQRLLVFLKGQSYFRG
ncbi:MAG: type II toxin-antitoxin system VapC family toxin, partial [Microcystis sp.]